jgi:hypothetical protein
LPARIDFSPYPKFMKHLIPHARERKVKINDANAKSSVIFLVGVRAR